MSELLDLYRARETSSRLAELHGLVHPTLEELAAELGFERAFVALVDVERNLVDAAVGVDMPEDLLDHLLGPLMQSLRLGQTLRVDDTLRDPRIPSQMREECLALGMLSFTALPLLPASAVLVVSKDHPVSEAELNELLPYTTRLTAAIVERIEARRLFESGERYAIEKEWLWWMVNAVQDPILLSDESNVVLLHNTNAERLFKSNPDDSPGKRSAIQMNNVFLSAALSKFNLDQGASFGRDLTLVDPVEGNELLYEVICKPATNLRTSERGLVSVLKDVTDLRRATEQIRRSLADLQAANAEIRGERDRLDLILENVADPIVVTDGTGQTILMNHQAQRYLQAPLKEVGERTEAIYRTNGAILSSFLSQLRLEAASVRRAEIQLADPATDLLVAMDVTATEVADSLGQVTAIVAVLHDLSQQRELEQRALKEQLFESEKVAAVGRLAAMVAHEINNPLEAIKNALHLVVTGIPPDDQNRRFLEIASKETERVSGIIRQMLGFYRPAVDRSPVEVNKVLEEALALLQRPLRQQHISVRLDLATDVPTILASSDQLKQVFLNLILNGRDAMPHGGILEVTTRVSRETDGEFMAGPYLLIQVRDTGVGIADEDLPRIFEPFYSTKTESKGTGLGLWVSLGIIQNFGGQIKVRSRPGRGTTFTVALPLEQELEQML
jgi:signal transduction histidine kinase